jgi:hypothetical protein
MKPANFRKIINWSYLIPVIHLNELLRNRLNHKEHGALPVWRSRSRKEPTMLAGTGAIKMFRIRVERGKSMLYSKQSPTRRANKVDTLTVLQSRNRKEPKLLAGPGAIIMFRLRVKQGNSLL